MANAAKRDASSRVRARSGSLATDCAFASVVSSMFFTVADIGRGRCMAVTCCYLSPVAKPVSVAMCSSGVWKRAGNGGIQGDEMKTMRNQWQRWECVIRRAALAMGLLCAPPVVVTAAVLDFEALLDGDALVSQYAGVMFANATVLTAGLSLNEFEFPPRSGSNVVFDDGGAMTLTFASPVASVSGYFTYLAGLRFEAFDGSDTSVGADLSDFVSNLAGSGDSGSAPNELFLVDFAAGIRKVVISGDALGASFTLDDLTFERQAGNSVPEPSSLALLAAGWVGWRRRGRRRGRWGRR